MHFLAGHLVALTVAMLGAGRLCAQEEAPPAGSVAFNGYSAALAPYAGPGGTAFTTRIDMGQVPLADLGALVDDRAGVLPSTDTLVEAAVYMPKGLALEDAAAFVGAVQEQLAKRYPNLKVIPVYIDVKQVANDAEAANREIRALPKDLPPGTLSPEVMDAMEEANLATAAEAEAWAGGFAGVRKWLNNPKTALVVGRLSGAVKAGAAALLWVSRVGFNLPGAALASVEAAAHFFTTYYAVPLGEWTKNHEIPWMKQNPLFSFYNRLRVLKAIVFNATVWNGLYRFGLKTIAFAGGVADVGTPFSVKFLGELVGLGLAHAVFMTAGTTAGFGKLARRGYLSGPALSYLTWSLGMGGPLSAYFQATGNFGGLVATLAVQWTTATAAVILAEKLPTRNNRFVFMHPALSSADQQDVRYLESIYETLAAKDLSNEELTREITKLETSGSLKRGLKSFAAGVAGLLPKIKNLVSSCEILHARVRSQGM